MQRRIRVVLAGDHPLVLKGLDTVLAEADDMVVVATTDTYHGRYL